MPPPGTLKKRPIDEKELEETLAVEFGLAMFETRTYLRLVTSIDMTPREVAESVGIPEERALALLAGMEKKGLIIKTTGGTLRYSPLHPRMTLTNIFKTYEQGVVQGLRDRRATVDRVVNLLTPIYEERRRQPENSDKVQ